MRITKTLTKIATVAKQTAVEMARCSSLQKKKALHLIADCLDENRHLIEKANQEDIQRGVRHNLPQALLDRLSLVNRLDDIISATRHIAELPDPIDETIEELKTPEGLQLKKVRVPLGVVAVVYEARPNVTVDVAAITLKTGNVAILRGGSETLKTNCVLVDTMQKGLVRANLPASAIQLITNPNRLWVKQLLSLDAYIDMVIPRGGASLHKFCKENSLIPVITGGVGICHLYVDASANLDKAMRVIVNAKTDRPSVCNALDTLLVSKAIAHKLLPKLVQTLESLGTTFRLDPKARDILGPHHLQACEEDWRTEWLSLVLGIRIVDSLEHALEHIRTYGSGHSDGILTETPEHRDEFLKRVDSAVVYVNASTRFTDGGQFGMGAEMAISTQKLHARGPMGLKELTTYKWMAVGDYHIRG